MTPCPIADRTDLRWLKVPLDFRYGQVLQEELGIETFPPHMEVRGIMIFEEHHDRETQHPRDRRHEAYSAATFTASPATVALM